MTELIQVIYLDNIDNAVLDRLVYLYKGRDDFRISDERNNRNYFLIGTSIYSDNPIEFTYIWIYNNLWYFMYCNTECSRKPSWRNPIELLNELLNDKL